MSWLVAGLQVICLLVFAARWFKGYYYYEKEVEFMRDRTAEILDFINKSKPGGVSNDLSSLLAYNAESIVAFNLVKNMIKKKILAKAEPEEYDVSDDEEEIKDDQEHRMHRLRQCASVLDLRQQSNEAEEDSEHAGHETDDKTDPQSSEEKSAAESPNEEPPEENDQISVRKDWTIQNHVVNSRKNIVPHRHWLRSLQDHQRRLLKMALSKRAVKNCTNTQHNLREYRLTHPGDYCVVNNKKYQAIDIMKLYIHWESDQVIHYANCIEKGSGGRIWHEAVQNAGSKPAQQQPGEKPQGGDQRS